MIVSTSAVVGIIEKQDNLITRCVDVDVFGMPVIGGASRISCHLVFSLP